MSVPPVPTLRRANALPDAPSQSEERCELCRFWPATHTGGNTWSGAGGHHCDGSASECRRRAPVEPNDATNDERLWRSARWPVTRRQDWCGEFDRRPEPPRPPWMPAPRCEGCGASEGYMHREGCSVLAENLAKHPTTDRGEIPG